jgi:chorismate mutase
MNSVRAFRGATQLSADTKEDMRSAVVELLKEMLSVNSLGHEDLISILFTATPDIQSDFLQQGFESLDWSIYPLFAPKSWI